ncbi:MULTISPECIES: hypothetical protein [Catenuloplanes]|uniref:Uncharacterized protein n=1 Tax=Catenuloplanes niger TaxID=587534 RepID=A0AAE3ZPK2_9ACTN|nr:hypothetical protein [Catenuloplanes niger]MDR7321923.1 hypothetical protein [Catenuloplanes niger]
MLEIMSGLVGEVSSAMAFLKSPLPPVADDACAAVAVWHETATFGEPPAEITVRSARSLTGEVAVEERDCGRRYATSHLCPVHAADCPVRSHLLDVPPFLTLFGLMFAGRLVARRIATRITGHPPARH